MSVDASAPPPSARNPGPSWGYLFLRGCDRVLPEFIFRPLRAIGTAVALVGMPSQRSHSREYLRQVLDREPTWGDVFRHFFAFEETLMLKLRVANGRLHECDVAPDATAFSDWLRDGGPMLLGSFHVGVSDLLGLQLGGREHREVVVVRQRVGNSHDIDALMKRFGRWLRIVWVNDPADLLFRLKEAAMTDAAIALQVDRVEFSARTAPLRFLGAERVFPITIYHLAMIFDRPVILSIGVLTAEGRSILHASPVFKRHLGEPRPEAMKRALVHFQAFLDQLEGLLRKYPYAWANFIPLNPVATAMTNAS